MSSFFEGFKSATSQICEDLSISPKSIKFDHYETPKTGLDYIADGKGKGISFNFHLRTETKEDDVTTGRITASLEIYYSESASSFYFHEDIDYLRGHSDFLGRWAAWAVFNYNIKHNPVNLDSLFNETDIKVYGLPRYTHPTIMELRIFFNGLRNIAKKVLVYRFRHPDDEVRYRSFSYAFYVYPGNTHLWVFFPELGGLDSGGAFHDYKTVEKLLKTKKIKIERKNFDISYKDLRKYLEEHALRVIGSHTVEKENLKLVGLDKPQSPFGIDFADSKQKFFDMYEKEEYPQALRSLRALVQEALERTCDRYRITMEDVKKRNIGKLSEGIIQKKIVDGMLREWFNAFTVVANLASHREFPSQSDMRNYTIFVRVELTFKLGIYLIMELENTFKQKPSISKNLNKDEM